MMRAGKLAAVIVGVLAIQHGFTSMRAQPSDAGSSPGGQLKQIAYLKASNSAARAHFGCGGVLDGHSGNGVAISGDGTTIAVGAPHESSAAKGINGNQNDNSRYDSGAVYVFVRNGTRWSQQAYIKASNAGEGDEFGHVVTLSADGNTLAVSAYFEASSATGINGNQNDRSIPQAGAVYVFTRRGSTWSQQAYLKASNTGEAGVGDAFGEGDQFGFSLTLSDDGNTIAVGAIGEDSNASGVGGNQADNSMNQSGAVYVFVRNGTSWSQQAYIKSSKPTPNVMFGYAVTLSRTGDTLVSSEYDGEGTKGAIYVFTRAGGLWSQEARLVVSIAERGDSFGVSLSLSDDGDTLAAGSHDEDCLATGVNPPGCNADQKTDTSTGAAMIFVRSGTTWSEQALLKASNTGKGDWFGARIAVSGDGNTVAVSAPLEDSSAQGINGKQDDDSASEAGAVYFFTRNGTTWTQQAYVKGSNTKSGDEFGSSVALTRDGRTMVVSARGEDSGARGVNGNQSDHSAPEAGAAYVFTR
ncbi:MAG: integrin [Blastocatellia bacterium]|nr:MAG: integrin [Blastocatellia bacterium]